MSVPFYRPGVSCLDTAFSRFLEASEYDSPVDVSPVADDPYSSPPQTYPGCFGLPYQDHNYGAPPPLALTPPPAPPPKENFELKEEIVVTSDLLNQPLPNMPPQPSIEEEIDDPTRCICDFIHDDGYMIQCDQCSVWQHIVCMGLDRDSIPDTYLCEKCHPRPVDRARAREFQIRKREFLKTLVITSHDSSATDTDPEEVNNRLKAYGLDASQAKQEKQKQKMKVKKRKERANSRNNKKLKLKEEKIEKENANKELNKKHKLMVRDFASKTALAKKEKLTKKIEKMRAERISKEMRDDKLGCEGIKDDERIINNIKTVTSPVIQDENAQNAWDIQSFNEWEQSYEVAKYNQYTTYVQEYLNSTYMNGHQNEIADLVTDGLRVQRCHIKDLKSRKKGLESTCNIPNGQPVIEVIGKVMTRHQYDKDNFGQRQLSPFVFFYGIVFDLDLVIDASDYGNDARFIRRSCQPNAEVRHVVAGGQAHFIAVATKDIAEHTEITIPYDYDYKKWNFCVDCACLRNSCPISRYQKKRLRFQKLQIGERAIKKNNKNEKNLKLHVKSPVKSSPTKSPVKSHPKTPEKIEDSLLQPDSGDSSVSETVQPAISPIKMVRRSQVAKQSNVSTQVSASRVRSISVPSQEEDSSSVTESLVTPEPTTLRCSEVDTLTSPEIKDSSGKKNHEGGEPEKRKMTREERKMEAIMKAFEKMEKRNARKASIEHHGGAVKEKEVEKVKVKEKTKEKDEVKKEKETKQEPECDPPAVAPVIKEEVKEERVVVPEVVVQQDQPAPQDVKEVDDVKEVEKSLPSPPIPPQQPVKEKPVKGKKNKKAAARRRTRNCSGASGPEVPTQVVSLDESSNSVGAISMLPSPSISCPVTPAEGPATPPSFKFVKTKRHLMNEWYSEKVTDTKPPAKSEPLQVSVPDDSMFVTCLPSPRNSLDKLRRNSQSNGSRDRYGVATDNSVGSAKKRWLRQAMGEESSEPCLSSPVPPSGGMSPNPQMAMPSPCASPPVDFVTPLKKRRLARESLSRESIASESPTPTPTPTSTVPCETMNTSYFSGLNETFESKMEEIRLKNGISSYFSTLKSAEEEGMAESNPEPQSMVPVDEGSSKEVNADLMETIKPPTSSSNNVIESIESGTQENQTVDNSAEVNCSSTENTGIEESPAGDLNQISNSDNVSVVSPSGNTGKDLTPSVEEEEEEIQVVEEDKQTEHSEQREQILLGCDDKGESKSAINSEPDSSEGVCSKTAETPMEVECDSVSMETSVTMETVTPSTSGASTENGEVDSTECSGVDKSLLTSTTSTNGSSFSHNTSQVLDSSLVSVVEPCDSCSSAGKVNSSMCHEQSRPRTNSSDKTCSSTSSTFQELLANRNTRSSHLLVSPEKLSVVDSSTDKTAVRRGSFSIGDRNLQNGSVQESSLSVSDSTQNEHQSLLDGRSEVSNSTDDTLSLPQVSSHHFMRSFSLNESFPPSGGVTPEPSTYPNRHLKFLNDSNYSTEMTVDSTTHFLASSSSGNAVLYDSDSMDVSSASEAGMNGTLEDKRNEDSFMELTTGGCESSQPPKEKKKVSLQEYLKRKKDKPCSETIQTIPAVSKPSSVSSTVTTPVKLATPGASLEKLPPMATLPSLPMFEKTERKEFKSSSDLLSPIFNRKEKQEEVNRSMSLSERLRQEFGLDDDIDTDSSTDNKTDQVEPEESKDIPPPPPPPPPQNNVMRSVPLKPGPVSNGNPIPPLMSLKPFPTLGITKPIQNTTNHVPGGGMATTNCVPQMVPPTCSSTVKAQTPSSKHPGNSPLPAPLGTLLASMKSPAQLQSDLTASLAALKAQISKVQQQSLPNSPSSSGTTVVNDQAPSTTQTITGANKALMFDYRHQQNSNFSRQNSYPSNSSNHHQTFTKSSLSSTGFNKASPGYNRVSPHYSKVSPPAGSQPYNSQTFNNHFSSRSPTLRSQKPLQKHSTSVSSTSRSKHKYS